MQEKLIRLGNAFFSPAGDNKSISKTSNNKSAAKPENKPSVKPEVKPAPIPEVKPLPKPEVKPIKKVTVKPETKPEVKPAPKPNTSAPVKYGAPVAGADGESCDYRTGDLPGCAPLAAAFVPMQRNADTIYDSNDALTRGTLFPGLDLPFMDIANQGNPYAGTPLGELMAVSFVAHELVLYLDTHKNDREAFALLQKMLKLKKEAHKRYTALFGPVTPDDLLDADEFNWTHGPWPWETPAPGMGASNTSVAAERK